MKIQEYQGAVDAAADNSILKMLQEYDIHMEHLTTQQLAAVIKQAITCGDLQRLVHVPMGLIPLDGRNGLRIPLAQSKVVYLPYAAHRQLEEQLAELRQKLEAAEAARDAFTAYGEKMKHQRDDLALHLKHAAYWFDQLNKVDAERYLKAIADVDNG